MSVSSTSRTIRTFPFTLALLLLGAVAPSAARAEQKYQTLMTTNQMLSVGQSIGSFKHTAYAELNPDGRLCTYLGRPPNPVQKLSCFGPEGKLPGPYVSVLQADGNLCTFAGDVNNRGALIWCNGGNRGAGTYTLQVYDDGRLAESANGGSPFLVTPKGTLTAAGFQFVKDSGIMANDAPTTFTANFAQQNILKTDYPGNQACGTLFTVPNDVYLVLIRLAGGWGGVYSCGSPAQPCEGSAGDPTGMKTAVRGLTSGMDGTPGRGAVVTGYYPVTPGQKLYVVPAFHGKGPGPGFPGGGASTWSGSGGGASFVATAPPVRVDSITCKPAPGTLMVVAGGGGGGGMGSTTISAGNGGDAGLLNGVAGAGQAGNGTLSGGGGGGGSQTGGGIVGSHPGCGTELRTSGDYFRGGDMYTSGGGGGAGLYGGGAGGGGDCLLGMMSGPGGGGGGSSWVMPGAFTPASAPDTSAVAGVTIYPIRY